MSKPFSLNAALSYGRQNSPKSSLTTTRELALINYWLPSKSFIHVSLNFLSALHIFNWTFKLTLIGTTLEPLVDKRFSKHTRIHTHPLQLSPWHCQGYLLWSPLKSQYRCMLRLITLCLSFWWSVCYNTIACGAPKVFNKANLCLSSTASWLLHRRVQYITVHDVPSSFN